MMIKGTKSYTWRETPEYKVVVQECLEEYIIPVVHVHVDINTKMSKSLYRELKVWYNKLLKEYSDYPVKTVVEDTDKMLRFAEHFGFVPTHLIRGKYYLMEYQG